METEQVDDGPVEAPEQSSGASYRCPSCAAEMVFDAASQKLACAHCGTSVPVPAEQGNRSIVEYNLDQRSQAPRGLGAQTKASRCQECGATVSFLENVTSTKCDFCGSSQVMAQEENRNHIRPESLVPFKVDGKDARARFGKWLGKLWFRPSDLKNAASVQELGGIYVPYWAFDARVDSRWTAQAGYHYYVSENYTARVNGKSVTRTRRVRKTRWRHAWGSRGDTFDDVLVCASRGLPEKLADRLKTFDTGALLPYEAGYLVGWRAEEYAIDLNGAWKSAVAKMEAIQERRCAKDVPGDTHRFLNVVNQFRDERYKHVLLPIWLAAYRYHEKVYQFLVNGQTGEVVGKAPWSVLKIVLFILAIAGVIAGIVALVMSQQ